MPDTVALRVTGRFPVANAIDVPVNTLITATFSELMDVTTINQVTFNVFKAEAPFTPVSGTRAFQSSTNRAIYTIGANLEDNTKYQVVVVGVEDEYATVKIGVQDAAGNYMDGNETWTFTTGTTTTTTPTEAALPSGVTSYELPMAPVFSGVITLSQDTLKIIKTNPAHYDTNVPVTQDIEIWFNDHPEYIIGTHAYGKAVYGSSHYMTASGFYHAYIEVDNRESLGDSNPSQLPLIWGYQYDVPRKKLTLRPTTISQAASNVTSHWWADGLYTGGGIVNGVLEESNEYTVTIHSGFPGSTKSPLANDFVFMFTTIFDPLFVSVDVIRLNLGSLIEDVPDDTINRIITENGRFALRLYPKDVRVTGVPWYLTKYVECKSKLDALNAQILGLGGIHGRKVLADLTIDRGNQGRDIMAVIEPKLEELQICVSETEAILIGGGDAATADYADFYKYDPRHPIKDGSWTRLPHQVGSSENARPGLFGGGPTNFRSKFQRRRRI